MGKASNRKSIRIVSIMQNNECTDFKARKIFQDGKKQKRLSELAKIAGSPIYKTEGSREQFSNFQSSVVSFTPSKSHKIEKGSKRSHTRRVRLGKQPIHSKAK